MASNPGLSVVITSYSTERLNDIYELLDGIKTQTYSNIETVFVVEKSQELRDCIQAYAQEKAIPDFRVIFNKDEQGASAARNLGIRHARGKIIAFIDDDALPFPDWAEAMVRTYTDDAIIGVTGLALPLWENRAMDWFPEELQWLVSCTSWMKTSGIMRTRNIWLQNGSFRREAFDQAGLLNTSLGPQDSVQGFKGREARDGIISEEVEISLRVVAATKKHIVYNPAVKVQHRVSLKRLDPAYIRQWSYWIGYSKHKVKKLYPELDANLLQQEHQLLRRIITGLLPSIMITFCTHPVLAWRKLRVTITALVFVTCGYYAHLLQGKLPGHKEKTFRVRRENLFVERKSR